MLWRLGQNDLITSPKCLSYVLQDAGARVMNEGQYLSTLLTEAWLGQKVEGHAMMVATLKVSHHRRLEAGGIARCGHM
jgi:hypothetical protein